MDFDVTIWILIIGAPLALIAGFFIFRRKRPPKEEPLLYFRCPGCKRKLKYQARQAGHKGMCSSCREPLTFPSPLAAKR